MLEHIDLNLSISKAEYKRKLPRLQKQLYELAHSMFVSGIPSIVVFEGWATSGKGSTIKVLTERLDARGFRVVPIMPPRTFETQYPWLWRFWLKIPPAGQMMVFDQSWYRRVLIDRLMKSVRKKEWKAAYQDINDFEQQLTEDGTVIVKFWFHISKKEQNKRFKQLMKKKLTSWQVSDEDALQNKSHKKYLDIVEEMLANTDRPDAPWTIVQATDKNFTRIKVYESLIRAFRIRLKVDPHKVEAYA
jgi:polyphosphate kinase 2 (PPK2 family)